MSYYSVETDTSHSLPAPSKKCETLRKKMLSNWGGVFKNTLGKEDRVNIEPVRINLRSVYSARPFDTPYYLRDVFDRELKDMLDAGILEPNGLRESDWCSRSFPVQKGDGSSVRLVSDFKSINRCIKSPNHPTDSANQ